MSFNLLVMGGLFFLSVVTFLVGLFVIRNTKPAPTESSPSPEELEEEYMEDPPW